MALDEGLQRMIAAAMTDDAILTALLHRPISLAHRFRLTVPERRFLAGIRARDLEHFAALVETWKKSRTAGHPPAEAVKELVALARVLIYGDCPDPDGRQSVLPSALDLAIQPANDAAIWRPSSIAAFVSDMSKLQVPNDRRYRPASVGRHNQPNGIIVLRQTSRLLSGKP